MSAIGANLDRAIAFALRGLSGYLAWSAVTGIAGHRPGLKQDVALARGAVGCSWNCGNYNMRLLRGLRLPWIFLSYAVDIFVEQE